MVNRDAQYIIIGLTFIVRLLIKISDNTYIINYVSIIRDNMELNITNFEIASNHSFQGCFYYSCGTNIG